MHKTKKPPVFVGVDPGDKGAICALRTDTQSAIFLETTLTPIAMNLWFNQLKDECDIRVIMIEKVHAISGASAGSSFSFGRSFQKVITIAECSGKMVDFVTPKKWQKHIGVTKKGQAIKKDVAGICRRLYPNSEIYGPRGGLLDGRSDALMIAHYASQVHIMHL